MSEKLNRALEFANYRVTLNNQQEVLRTKTEALLIYSVNGGSFTVDRNLVCFTKLLIDDGETEAVLLDNYKNPIRVELADFYAEIRSRYFEVTNDYHYQFEKLRKARKVQNIVDINAEK